MLLDKINEMYELTNSICLTQCKTGFNCCKTCFCNETEQQAKILGLKDIPYRDENGTFLLNHRCQIPGKYRPFCSWFICPDVLKKQPEEIRRKHKNLKKKLLRLFLPILKDEFKEGRYNPKLILSE
jgi:hypothetical protein